MDYPTTTYGQVAPDLTPDMFGHMAALEPDSPVTKHIVQRPLMNLAGRPPILQREISKDGIVLYPGNVYLAQVNEKICGKLLHARAIQVIAEGNTYSNAEDAVYKFSQIGLFAFSSASWETALAQTMNLQKEDVLLVFSNSGEAKSLLVQIDEAKKRGITVISLTNHENSPIAQKSDLHWRTVARPKVLMSEYYYSRLALVSAIEAMFILILKKEPKRLERIKFHELLMADKKI